MKMFYATREKYPATRVDLQDLFSARICKNLNMSMDWHMQSMQGQATREKVKDAAGDTVFLGQASFGKGFVSKLLNQWFAFWHDCMAGFYIRSHSYDIIQVRDKFWVALIALFAMNRQQSIFCYWMSFPYVEADLYRIQAEKHAYSWWYRLFYLLRGKLTYVLLYKIILPRADFVFVQSERMLDDVAKKGVAREKMMAVPMGIAWNRLQHLPEPKILNIKDTSKVAVYMGTMVKVRRLDFVLQAFVHVLVQEKDAILFMVGGAGDDVHALQQVAEDLGIAASVVFTGLVDMQEAWSYVLASDICLSPFRPSPILDSTSPTKVVEYLALAKPVVVNDHPDQSQVIGESQAGIVTAYTPEAFAQGILTLFAQPEQWTAIGQRGKAYVQNMRNYDVIAQQVTGTYQTLLQAHKE